jgi:ubiquinone/menaquinone biosynthesis C-methylase UbiE
MLIPLRRRGNPQALFVGMIDVRMGDRVAQIGCAHGGRLAAIASKVGLSGRAVVVVLDEASAERARKSAAAAGVLVEIERGTSTSLPLDDGGFDLVVIDETAGLLSRSQPEDRSNLIKEARRALRPGGRLMIVGAAARGGLGALLGRAQAGPPFDPEPWLQSDGFNAVRRLAEREHLVFVEGVKPKSPQAG